MAAPSAALRSASPAGMPASVAAGVGSLAAVRDATERLIIASQRIRFIVCPPVTSAFNARHHNLLGAIRLSIARRVEDQSGRTQDGGSWVPPRRFRMAGVRGRGDRAQRDAGPSSLA